MKSNTTKSTPSCNEPKTAMLVGDKERLSVKIWQHAQITVLCIVVLIVWGLLSLPVVFYFLPNGDDELTQSVQELTCTPAVYRGDVCKDELQSQQDCLPDRLGSSDVYISIRDGDNQEELETQAMQLLNGLSLISASAECEKAVLPFLCLYLFGLCDSNGTFYHPSSMDCLAISTDVCQREWIAATNFLGQETLPQCESLPVESLTCDNAISGNDNVSNITTDSCSVECRDGFYINTTLCACFPRCDTWELYSHTTTVITDVFTLLSASIGLISCIAVLVISCIRRKRVFVFPSVFIVYSTITLVVFVSVVLIAYTDRSELYCTSMDLQQSLENTSAFCSAAGAIFYYTLLQLALWWFFHVSAMFWKINFPFNAKEIESTHCNNYIHITMVLLSLVLPLVPVIAAFVTKGFMISQSPPILCWGSNANASFYSLVLPIILLLTVGITMLIAILWTIHKQGLFRKRLSRSFKADTAERRVLIIFCYYVLLGVITLTAFTLATKNDSRVFEEISRYFTCELPGVDPHNSCDQSHYQALLYPELNCISYVLLGIYPVAHLVWVVNVQKIKERCACGCLFHFFHSVIPAPKSSSTGSISAAVANQKNDSNTVDI